VLQKLLGHLQIETTMVYLHLAQHEHLKAHSPFDTLYAKTSKGCVQNLN